jgi:hypothetical protein
MTLLKVAKPVARDHEIHRRMEVKLVCANANFKFEALMKISTRR